MIIGIVSDSHGYKEKLEWMLKVPEAKEAECWLHAGDLTSDAEYLEIMCGKPVYKVAGNGDWPYSAEPEELLLDIGGHCIYLVHGHNQGVRSGTEILVHNAAQRGADIVVYGHTHIADITPAGQRGVTVLNPGSIGRPRDESDGSFMLLGLEPGKEPRVKLFRLQDSGAFSFV